MDKFQRALDYYQSVRKAFSESFPMISLDLHDWGYTFNWPKLNIQNVNFSMLQSDEEISQIVKTLKNSVDHKLYSIRRLDPIPKELEFKNEIGVFWREKSKIHFPIFDDGSIEQHYYGSNKKINNIKSLLKNIADLFKINSEDLIEFERYSGGLLHIQNGKIWTFEIEGNLISTIMEIENDEFESIKVLEFFITNDRFRNRGHGKKLLQALLSTNTKFSHLIFGREEVAFLGIMNHLGFNKIGKIFTYQIS